MLLAYRQEPSFYAVGQTLGLHHQTVQRCIERAKECGVMASLDDRPRPGKEPSITVEAKAWFVALACRKPKELCYPHELWTTGLLAAHARKHGPAAGHACLSALAQGTVCKILDAQEIKPHKVRYYLERRDPDFKEKMAEVLCVYRKVEVLKKSAAAAAKRNEPQARRWRSFPMTRNPAFRRSRPRLPTCRPSPAGAQALPASSSTSATALSACWPASTLLTGKVHALVKDRHRIREFVEFLKLLDRAYPSRTAIKLILDNHSALVSKVTKSWLAAQPDGRFELTFTPKHGSWLNLIEGFFSKFARSVLRHIRVTSKRELKDRIMAAMDFFNQNPIVHTWSYKLNKAA
jgi:transposase